MTERPPTIGLVLGGGGIAGYAFHAALLATIEEETGFDPRTAEIIVGTSAGAIAAAVLRGGVRASVLSARLEASSEDPRELANLRLLAGRTPRVIPRFWTGPGSPQLMLRELRRGRKMRVARLLGGLAPEGRLSLAPISEPIAALHQDGWPDRELWIPATDLETGNRLVFGRDQWPGVAEAVSASAALPGFFAPADIDDRTFIDGGLASPFNADLLVGYHTDAADDAAPGKRPLDLVLVSAPLSIDELNRRHPVASAVRTVPRRQLDREVAGIEEHGTKTLVLQPDKPVVRAMGLNPMDHNRISAIHAKTVELLRSSLAAADPSVRQTLETAGRMIVSPPDVPYPAPAGVT